MDDKKKGKNNNGNEKSFVSILNVSKQMIKQQDDSMILSKSM